MKKYVFLTSVLALAACGGGSGGGHSDLTPVRAAIDPTSPIATEVAESNAHITSMTSEVLVANNGDGRAPLLGRSASTNYEGRSYTSYRLEDVQFRFAGEENATLKFGIDGNGKIISVGRYENDVLSNEGVFARSGDSSNLFGAAKSQYEWSAPITSSGLAAAIDPGHIPGGWDADGIADIISVHFGPNVTTARDNNNLSESAIKSALIAEISAELDDVLESQENRDALTDAFADALAYYSGQINSANIGEPEIIKMKLSVEGANAGLKFADFGTAHMRKSNATETDIREEVYAPYLGGYDALKINKNNLDEGGSEFTGVAIAGIDHTIKTSGVKTKTGVRVRDDNAHLVMRQDGSADLIMNNLVVNDGGAHNGEKWYNLTVQKGADNVPVITISGSNEISGYDLPNETEILAGAFGSDAGIVNFSENNYDNNDHEYVKNDGTGGNGTRSSANMNPTAYGLNGTPEEAISSFSFGDQKYYSTGDYNEVAIYGAFGGTKQ